ncbi:hypothetical protein GCM10027168_62560 [Streptomyces capparidis]
MLVTAAAVLTAPAAAGADTPRRADGAEPVRGAHRSVTVERGGKDRVVPLFATRTGEAVLTVTSRAPGVSWQTAGSESAVVSAFVDGRHATDIVIPSDRPVERSFTLGRLTAGPHQLRLRFAADRSPAGATEALLTGLRVRVHPGRTAQGLVQRHAPIMYGRDLPELGGRFQSATTDTPLLAYHEVLPAAAPGHKVLQYTVIWSNEDGGTNSPALMARWGRTTDIEWAYRVEVDAEGDRVPGTAVYQASDHRTLPFTGTYEGDRPRLETCTSNNNMCDTVDNPMRFSLSPDQTLPAGQPREHLMDTNPWTYPVMAQEMLREGRVESPPDPATFEVGDQRTYLYIAIAHTASPADQTGNIGLAVGVRLKGRDTLYTSHHGVPAGSVTRDGTAATTVELPVGTGPSDIAEIVALRSPVTETGASLSVTRVTRAFFLGEDYLPQASFAEWTGELVLTPAVPSAVVWAPRAAAP